MRSKLFVPATRPDFFAKALGSDADAISFDLEDAVPADAKTTARMRLAEFLAGDAIRATGKTIIVRINAVDSGHFQDDLIALAHARIDLINLPKGESAKAVRAAAEAILQCRAQAAPARLLVNIETARGLIRAGDIAVAHPMVAGLQVGLNDLFAQLGIGRRREHVHAALWTVRVAAGAAGCFAYDGAWPDLTDAAGFRGEAELARSLGFLGKSCIHPSQIAIANTVFGIGAVTMERARRIVAGARGAAAAGRGAFALDGEMIDAPMIRQAEAMLAANDPEEDA
ncbi:CoA ester lyase [Sphingomonas sp.]|uniref:HpcH/HpaI aldolase/citrate lyase family protein n=1 Tax=Sphingomonas sp. TaxID=28214 RepID=UPI002D7E526F|nr:CoA ester lyase [Sphingomonas sp.]HEU0043970.1 CoA ester lyase [Sphingomonas sp.]